ncbi:MAG: preprotein translocase subunit SecE [Planctomycetota bacterium]
MYKKGQGTVSRSGAVILFFLFGAYSGYSWYQAWLGMSAWAGWTGALALLLGFSGAGAVLALYRPKTSDFFIEMDAELRKVIWPATQPVFDAKAEAWGATYVVIVTVIVLTLFIYVVDRLLMLVWQQGVLQQLFHL